MRYDVTFTGRVQGVGFRATACDIAQRYGVKGYVRNESDGSVRLVAEGPQNEIDRFLDDIRGTMGGMILADKVERHPETHGYQAFEIRR